MSESSRKDFLEKLKAHDWYYAYSDDHRYWTAGSKQRKELLALHEALSCPYSLDILCKWAHKMVVEEFAEESPNEWYRQPRIYKSIAPARLEDLITQNKWNEIQGWLSS